MKLNETKEITVNTNELESKGYVASAEDIEAITQAALDATALGGTSRMTYLRALVATTQQQLGMTQTRRRGVPPAMDEAEIRRQLEALETVQERFYPAVMRTVQATPLLEDERGQDRNAVFNRRATFARTAKATVKAWISSGHNLKGLVASKVTKYALQAEVVQRRVVGRAPSQRFLTGVTSRLIDRIKAARSPEDSIRLLEGVINQLVSGLMELGVETTTRLEDAIKDHKLLKTQTGVVWAAQPAEGRRVEREPEREAA